MERKTGLIAVVLAVTLLGSAVTAAVVANEHQQAGNETEADFQNQTLVSVVHMSPDAPAVDVMAGNTTLAENVSFGDATQYAYVPAGEYTVTVTAADGAGEDNATETPMETPEEGTPAEETPDEGTPTEMTPGEDDATDGEVLYETNVTLDAREVTSVVAQGEATEGGTAPFELVPVSDDAWTPEEDNAALRVAHFSPDAPAVDVTAGNGSVVLAENVTFGNTSEYASVPAGEYTAEIRVAAPDNNGTVVTTANVTLESEEAYTAWAGGYAAPEEAAGNESLQVFLTQDASATIELPGEDAETPAPETPTPEGTETPGMNETETPDEGTETPGMNETETPDEGTATPEAGTPGEDDGTPAEGEA